MKIEIYRTIILPVVFYGCETWPLTLREEHRLSLFENRVLRRIFGHNKDELTGKWRRLHNEKLYYPGDQIKKNETGGDVSGMGNVRGAYGLLGRS
jgi:hypothetical protein